MCSSHASAALDLLSKRTLRLYSSEWSCSAEGVKSQGFGYDGMEISENKLKGKNLFNILTEPQESQIQMNSEADI